jgi:hypothetical protein
VSAKDFSCFFFFGSIPIGGWMDDVVGIVLGFFFIHVSKHCMRTVIEKKTYAA